MDIIDCSEYIHSFGNSAVCIELQLVMTCCFSQQADIKKHNNTLHSFMTKCKVPVVRTIKITARLAR